MRSFYVMDAALLLRRTCRNAKSVGWIFLPAVACFLAGCSEVPPEYNPIEWGQSAVRGVSSLFESDKSKEGKDTAPRVVVEPPPAEGRPYPNLGMVPKPPPRDTDETRMARYRELVALRADHDAAVAADAALRKDGTVPGPAAPSAVAVPPPATAPAAPPAPASTAMSPPMPAPAQTPALAPTPAPAPPVPAPVPVSPPSSPSTVAAATTPGAAAPVLTTSERHGAVTFGRDTAALTDRSQQALRDAAALAVARSGRVRLVPAEYGHEAASPQQLEDRAQAMVQVLTRAGLPANRVTVADNLAQRVDIYDVYVDY